MSGKSEHEKWVEKSIENLDWNIDATRKWTEEWVDYLETEVMELRNEVAKLQAQLKSLKSGMQPVQAIGAKELQELIAQAVNECLGTKTMK